MPDYINSALQLASGVNRGGTRGAQSALAGVAGLSNLPQAPQLQGVSNALGGAGNALGVINGIDQGGVAGYGSSALNATALAGRSGLFDADTNKLLNTGASDLASGLGIYRGIQQGGVSGYGSAAVNAAKLATNLGAFGGAGGALGSAAGYAAIPLSLYNEINNWESGNTGSDAMGGAATGAAIGSVVPGIGTLVGGLVGGAAGAISSLFGPGRSDPETGIYKKFEQVYKDHPEVASQVQNPFLSLAGVFDQRNSSLPMYQAYGRMREGDFTKDMTGKINAALADGTISKDSTAPEIMNKVVNPWIGSMGSGWNKDPASFSEQASTDALVQQMVDQYIHGQQGNWKSIGGDYNFGDLKPFGKAEGGSVRYYDSGGPIDTGISPDDVTVTGDRSSSYPALDWNQFNIDPSTLQDPYGGFDPNSVHVLDSVNSALNPSLMSKLGSALKNPSVLAALLGGGLGVAASGGKGTPFSFNPPAPFAPLPSGPSRYGNFSPVPRQQTNPQIDYAHAAEHGPVPQFYTPEPQYTEAMHQSALQQAAAPPPVQPNLNQQPLGAVMNPGSSGMPEIPGHQQIPTTPSQATAQQAPAPAVNQFLAQIQQQQAATTQQQAARAMSLAAHGDPGGYASQMRTNNATQGGFAGLAAQAGRGAPIGMRPVTRFAGGGEIGHSPLLLGHQLAQGKHVKGEGDGTSDDIPAMLSEGEYVIPAHVVSALGNGSNEAGAKSLDALQERVRLRVGKQMAAGKHPARIGKPESFMKAAK